MLLLSLLIGPSHVFCLDFSAKVVFRVGSERRLLLDVLKCYLVRVEIPLCDMLAPTFELIVYVFDKVVEKFRSYSSIELACKNHLNLIIYYTAIEWLPLTRCNDPL